MPDAFLTTIVTVSVAPDARVDVARLTVELPALMEPAVTVNVGLVVRATPFTLTVIVLVLPAVAPVMVAVYVPGTALSVTAPKVPVLVPPERLKLKAELLMPLKAFPAAS